MQGLLVFHSFKGMRYLLPDQLPVEHTGDMAAVCRFMLPCDNLGKCTVFLHLHYSTSANQAVGHIPMVHTCSFMCTNHIDMIAHTLAFLQVGEYSHHPDFHHTSSQLPGHGKIQTWKSQLRWQVSTLTIHHAR